MDTQKGFQAFSDESGINYKDPYTSIPIVSGEEEVLNCLRDKLVQEINDKGINEVKFTGITRHKSPVTQAAIAFIRSAVNDFAKYRKIRIDTMTMDNQYLLSTFPDYDNEQKLEHMYHCLLSHIGRQWNNTRWNFYPDINSKVNWNKIINFLSITKLHRGKCEKPLLIELILQENPKFQFDEIRQISSVQEPLIQLADLFAGLACFSHEENMDCSKWFISKNNGWQLEMKLSKDIKISNISRKSKCRYQLIGELYNLCGRHSLWVSIKTRKHLWTRKKNSPVNFWDYEKRILVPSLKQKNTLTTG